MKSIDRKGEIGTNKETLGGYEMKIVEYKNNQDITIEFQDEHKARVHTTYQNFKKGNVKNPYDKTICGVGYYGQGKYKASEKDGKHTKIYNTWVDMIRRCYDPYFLDKHPTYRDCVVCEDWLNFQNFAKWYEDNYYEVDEERMELDKDILCKGNKIYSPETCVFVPHRINVVFTKRQNDRGEYPIGCIRHKRDNIIQAQCTIIGENGKRKNKYLGHFPLNRPFQAFYTYKVFKENYIKQVADEYKDLIPQKLYKALYKWEVEIND